MTTVSTKSGRIIKVVSREEEKSTLTESDSEMDERAVEAVKAAINKAKICKKPIAGYDKEKKRAYVEYANGERKYAEQKTDDSCISRTKWLGEKYNNHFFDKVGKYTNADDVVATTGMNNMEAAVLVDRMRYESIAKKEDFTFETVLSSEYKLNILRKAKEEGYFIKCVFVLTVDPQINIARIEISCGSRWT